MTFASRWNGTDNSRHIDRQIVESHINGNYSETCRLISRHWQHCSLKDNPDARLILITLVTSDSCDVRQLVSSLSVDVAWTQKEIVDYAIASLSSTCEDTYDVAVYLCGTISAIPDNLKQIITTRLPIIGCGHSHLLTYPSSIVTSAT